METVIVKTEKTVFGGNTIAKIDSKTVFIPYTLPGETLSINIVQHKNDYDNAEIVKIIEPSPYRVTPECKYYGLCGGCNMLHISPEHQRELRKQMLKDAFTNNKIDLSNTEIQTVYDSNTEYRCRFQLNNGGLSEKKSNNIISIKNCICAEKVINEYLENLPEKIKKQGRIHIFGSEKLTSDTKILTEIQKEEKIVHKNIQPTKKSKKMKFKENRYFAGTVLSEENSAEVQLLDKKIRFDVRGFFQSNLKVFEKVLQLIKDLLPGGKNILDMYAGCGSISAFLADKYENVALVEHNRDALVYAEQNMSGKGHISYGLSGEQWVKTCSQFGPAFDACMIDPPRSGMEYAVADYLCKSKIPFICSMSCDPATHARDCAKLIKAGYELKQLYLLDFYPNTSHIESLAFLQLKTE